VGKRFGLGCAVAGTLSLVLISCGGSGAGGVGGAGGTAQGAAGSAGGGAGSETFTPFPDCLPPCLETALTACIGNSTVCSTTSNGICWDTGAHATLIDTPIDAGVQEQDEIIYTPGGALCLTKRIINNGPDYAQNGTYTDANGNVIATLVYDPQATYSYALHCDGKTYALTPVLLSSTCTDNANVLDGNACSATTSQCR
jgi:hypothetical protein